MVIQRKKSFPKKPLKFHFHPPISHCCSSVPCIFVQYGKKDKLELLKKLQQNFLLTKFCNNKEKRKHAIVILKKFPIRFKNLDYSLVYSPQCQKISWNEIQVKNDLKTNKKLTVSRVLHRFGLCYKRVFLNTFLTRLKHI